MVALKVCGLLAVSEEASFERWEWNSERWEPAAHSVEGLDLLGFSGLLDNLDWYPSSRLLIRDRKSKLHTAASWGLPTREPFLDCSGIHLFQVSKSAFHSLCPLPAVLI